MDDRRLSHYERTMLDALELWLRRDDPGFVAWFTLESQSLGAPPGRPPRDVIARWLRRRGDEDRY